MDEGMNPTRWQRRPNRSMVGHHEVYNFAQPNAQPYALASSRMGQYTSTSLNIKSRNLTTCPSNAVGPSRRGPCSQYGQANASTPDAEDPILNYSLQGEYGPYHSPSRNLHGQNYLLMANNATEFQTAYERLMRFRPSEHIKGTHQGNSQQPRSIRGTDPHSVETTRPVIQSNSRHRPGRPRRENRRMEQSNRASSSSATPYSEVMNGYTSAIHKIESPQSDVRSGTNVQPHDPRLDIIQPGQDGRHSEASAAFSNQVLDAEQDYLDACNLGLEGMDYDNSLYNTNISGNGTPYSYPQSETTGSKRRQNQITGGIEEGRSRAKRQKSVQGNIAYGESVQLNQIRGLRGSMGLGIHDRTASRHIYRTKKLIHKTGDTVDRIPYVLGPGASHDMPIVLEDDDFSESVALMIASQVYQTQQPLTKAQALANAEPITLAPTDFRYVEPILEHEKASITAALDFTRKDYRLCTGKEPPQTSRDDSYASQWTEMQGALSACWKGSTPVPQLVLVEAFYTSLEGFAPPFGYISADDITALEASGGLDAADTGFLLAEKPVQTPMSLTKCDSVSKKETLSVIKNLPIEEIPQPPPNDQVSKEVNFLDEENGVISKPDPPVVSKVATAKIDLHGSAKEDRANREIDSLFSDDQEHDDIESLFEDDNASVYGDLVIIDPDNDKLPLTNATSLSGQRTPATVGVSATESPLPISITNAELVETFTIEASVNNCNTNLPDSQDGSPSSGQSGEAESIQCNGIPEVNPADIDHDIECDPLFVLDDDDIAAINALMT